MREVKGYSFRQVGIRRLEAFTQADIRHRSSVGAVYLSGLALGKTLVFIDEFALG